MNKNKRLVRIAIIIIALIIVEIAFVGVPRIKALLIRENQEEEISRDENLELSGENSLVDDEALEGEEIIEEGDIEAADTEVDDEKNSADYSESDHLTLGLKGTNPTLVKEGEPYIESGAFCIDDRTGIIKPSSVEGAVDTSKPGEYTIKYTFESEKARGEIERKINVIPAEDFEAREEGIAVFMYHYVYTEDDVPDEINGNYILDSELEKQLSWLKDNNYYFPSFDELRAFVDGELSLPKNSCILTFDDGQKGFLNYGIPLLEKYEIPAVSFLIVSYDAENIMRKNASPYISFESHSYDMHKAGGYIGHGGVISAMTKDEIVSDLKKASEILGSSAGFAYPYGDYTDEAREAVIDAGVLCSFTTEWDWVTVGADPSVLPRVRIVGDAGLDSFIGSL